ncbi:MAG: hypothetical protein K6A65_03680 [Succinivibrionaceae bacterium]|nr:hypothetical protein [Succinivibrionaceae bacterium]
MAHSKSTTYFFEVFLPNEGETENALEIAVLSHESGAVRPQVYLHSFLRPASLSRVRWGSAAAMGITRELISGMADLPSLADIMQRRYLKDLTVVCFDKREEPYRSMCAPAFIAYSIVDEWRAAFDGNSQALSCETLKDMLAYIGWPTEDGNRHYTPLMLRIHAMAAVWEYLEARKRLTDREVGGSHSSLWPLPSVDGQWFSSRPRSLSDIPRVELDEFFSFNLLDHLDWFRVNVYGHDWVFGRKLAIDPHPLPGQEPITEYTFNKMSFQMQLWVLIYYTVFEQKGAFAAEIAASGGKISRLRSEVKSSFIPFFIMHLEDFLSAEEKQRLIHAILHQLLSDRGSKNTFVSYDFARLSREEHRKGHRDTEYTLISEPDDQPIKSFYEIRGNTGQVLYRKYEITGTGSERSFCANFVYHKLSEFNAECKDPFSPLWCDKSARDWIHYITGHTFAEICRTPRPNDPHDLSSVQSFLLRLIPRVTSKYAAHLYESLRTIVDEINSLASNRHYRKQFCFMGISIEVVVTPKTQRSFLDRILKLD